MKGRRQRKRLTFQFEKKKKCWGCIIIIIELLVLLLHYTRYISSCSTLKKNLFCHLPATPPIFHGRSIYICDDDVKFGRSSSKYSRKKSKSLTLLDPTLVIFSACPPTVISWVCLFAKKTRKKKFEIPAQFFQVQFVRVFFWLTQTQGDYTRSWIISSSYFF